ncbi:MAG: hypothetical protein HY903_10755 [Deltaproteobacteria bacterium]|nr:hypothetical protein [Deltaproteobacteria bacterium]
MAWWARSLWVLVAIACGAGCSLIVGFDADGRPCGPDNDGDGLGDCLPGYSCMVSNCVADGSVARDNTCTTTVQCQSGDVCAVPGFVCRKPCAVPFGAATECGAGMVCAVATDSHDGVLAACYPSQSDCTGACGNAGTCVLAAGRCQEGCAISCTTTGCSDACAEGQGHEDRTCQPIGTTDPVLICLPTPASASPGTEGAACGRLTLPCAKGFACVIATGDALGTCRRYCAAANAGACATQCSETTYPGGAHFGLCQ